MSGLYGHRWISGYGEDPRGVGGREWALTLAGIDRAQMDAGLDACRSTVDDWPPPAPVFKARCLGIPSFDAYRVDAAKRSTPFARLAAHHVDWYNFARAEHRDADRMLRSAYDLAVQRVMQGEPMPEELEAITHEPEQPKPATPGVGDAAIANIRAMLQGGEDEA